jgi:hypothetical protein
MISQAKQQRLLLIGNAHQAHPCGGLSKHTCSVSSSARAAYFQFFTPISVSCHPFFIRDKPKQTQTYLGVVRCDQKQRVKQMLTLGLLLNSEVVNTQLMNLSPSPGFMWERVSCALTTILSVLRLTKVKSMVM